jgi:ribulose-5-phosphate 4-epimerase/fuculose-1-phosphate aldolase
VVAGKTLQSAMYATEELEQTARLALMLRGADPNTLNAEQIADLDRHFPPW